MEIRPADDGDTPAVLDLLARSMRRAGDDERFAALFRWKHQANPFGPSPAWVAEEDGAVIGYRAFLRWELLDGHHVRRVARAVDTATHPDHQGRGIFRELTLHGLRALAEDGVELVFNTPNDQSRPGYLKMGWQPVAALRPWVRPRNPRTIGAIARSRVAAAHWGVPTSVGAPAPEVFADDVASAALLDACAGGRGTHRTPAYLRWRYEPDLLSYRALVLGPDLSSGVVCFRLRRRGRSTEVTIGDLLLPDASRRRARRAISEVLRRTGADYALALSRSLRDGMVRLPTGPLLVWRGVLPAAAPPEAASLSMGDIELF